MRDHLRFVLPCSIHEDVKQLLASIQQRKNIESFFAVLMIVVAQAKRVEGLISTQGVES